MYLEAITRFSTYNIDKVDFFTIVQKAKNKYMSDKNIESVWRATGLIPFNSTTVYRKLEAKENYIPSFHNLSVTIPRNYTNISILQILANLDQINRIDELISQLCNQILNTLKVVLLSKLVRRARLAIANCTILTKTNTELYKASI